MEIRTRYRAVTAEDFEFLAGEASPARRARGLHPARRRRRRCRCTSLPRVDPADRQLRLRRAHARTRSCCTEVAEYLDERRLIGTHGRAAAVPLPRPVGRRQPPGVAARRHRARRGGRRARALHVPEPARRRQRRRARASGWPFGRALNQGELYGVVHAVDGVEFVKILRVYETDLATGEQSPKPAGTHIVLEPDELIASGAHIVKATHREDRRSGRPTPDGSNGTAATVPDVRRARASARCMVQLASGPTRDAAGRLQPRVPAQRAARALPGRRLRDALRRRARGRCSTRSSRCSTRCPRTSTPTTRRATSSTCSPRGSGVELDESQDAAHQREMVRRGGRARPPARDGARARAGARARTSPSVPLRVEDNGGVHLVGRPSSRRNAPPPSFVVYCDKPIAEDDAGGDRALHRAVQAGAHDVPAAREGGEEAEGRHVMRTCQSCGKENPADRDFCACGEYLRWEPTGFVAGDHAGDGRQAAAEAAAPAGRPPRRRAGRAAPPAAAAARSPAPRAAPQAAAPPPHAVGRRANGTGPGSSPPAPLPGAVPRARRRPPRGARERRTITLRLPDERPGRRRRRASASSPASRERVLALIRNQSGIVDNYDLRVDGHAGGLVVDLPRPPSTSSRSAPAARTSRRSRSTCTRRAAPEAEARVWELEVVADSKAQRDGGGDRAARAAHPAVHRGRATTLRPQRTTGRRKADFDVAVDQQGQRAGAASRSTARTPTASCSSASTARRSEIPPGETVETTMRVRPPKQIWIGRPHERRLEVLTTSTGERGGRAPPRSRASAEARGRRRRRRRPRSARGLRARPGVHGPRVYKPQLYRPDCQIGPGGRAACASRSSAGPQVQGPQLQAAEPPASSQLKLPGRGAARPRRRRRCCRRRASSARSRGCRGGCDRRPAAAAARAAALPASCRRTSIVPDVVGKKSAFEAEKMLTEAELKLDPQTRGEGRPRRPRPAP